MIDWNPRHLYRKIFADSLRMEHFLANICTQPWNERHDEGRSFAENGAELARKHPAYAAEIRAYDERWAEMLNGPVPGTVELLLELKRRGRHRLFGLTNWSAEKFPIAEERFDFLRLFDGIVVSGRVGLKKPDPRIFRLLCDTHRIEPPETLFIDDSLPNVDAAARLGFHVHHFRSPAGLAADLRKFIERP